MKVTMGLCSTLAVLVLSLGIAGGARADVTADATAQVAQAGETCRVVGQTGFASEVATIALQTTVTMGPDKSGLACDVGWQRIESDGEQRCRTNYADGTLYRNGQLLPVSRNGGDCTCREGADQTICEISTSVQCGFEVMRTAGTQVCD